MHVYPSIHSEPTEFRQSLQSLEEGQPKTGVRSRCKLQGRCWKRNLGSYQQKQETFQTRGGLNENASIRSYICMLKL